MRNKKILAGIVATIAASLCCVTPVLAVVAGSSSFASSFSWMEPYHNYLVGLTIVILAYAWWDKLKIKKKNVACCPSDNGFFSGKIFLTIVTLFAIGMLTFSQWSGMFFDVEEGCNSCAAEVKQTTVKTAQKTTVTEEKHVETNDLPVLKYMSDEKANPTECNQKACSGTGFKEVDAMMANARKEVQEMSPAVLKKMIDNEEELILLDVRDALLRAEGEIYADTVLKIARNDLEFDVMNRIKDKNAVIITYDHNGGRSLFAAQTLKHLGYKNVYSLSGGLKGWARAGYPFDNALGLVVKVEDEQ